MVTPVFLMEGAHYALEQCGLLLHDAITLFRNKSYATATVLAALAREELGKAIELRVMRREALEGKTLTVMDIKRRCGASHDKKQERGQTSVVVRNVPLNDLLRKISEHDSQSEEYRKADAQLQEIVDKQKRRTPLERHQTRLKCLYVDPDDNGVAWKRPSDQTREDAETFLSDAANDYSTQYHLYHRGNVHGESKEFYDALQQWAARPELPMLHWR